MAFKALPNATNDPLRANRLMVDLADTLQAAYVAMGQVGAVHQSHPCHEVWKKAEPLLRSIGRVK